jgi:hypothetical protein
VPAAPRFPEAAAGHGDTSVSLTAMIGCADRGFAPC